MKTKGIHTGENIRQAGRVGRARRHQRITYQSLKSRIRQQRGRCMRWRPAPHSSWGSPRLPWRGTSGSGRPGHLRLHAPSPSLPACPPPPRGPTPPRKEKKSRPPRGCSRPRTCPHVPGDVTRTARSIALAIANRHRPRAAAGDRRRRAHAARPASAHVTLPKKSTPARARSDDDDGALVPSGRSAACDRT